MTAKARATLITDVATLFADNSTGEITPLDLRTFVLDVVDSAIMIVDDVTGGTLGGDIVVQADSINVLSDVDTVSAAPTNGQVLAWVTANGKWEPLTIEGAVVDATITDGGTNPVESNAIYDALALKVNLTDSIDALSDVDTTTSAPTDGQLLAWVNANSNWEPVDVPNAPRYQSSHDATTSWGAASGGFYTISVTAATHGRGTSPTVLLYEDTGTEWILTTQASANVKINKTTGNVLVQVTEAPDERYAGKIVVF